MEKTNYKNGRNAWTYTLADEEFISKAKKLTGKNELSIIELEVLAKIKQRLETGRDINKRGIALPIKETDCVFELWQNNKKIKIEYYNEVTPNLIFVTDENLLKKLIETFA
ncbi:MAG: hypothetical protein ACRCUS_06235 [Anaerovoracaceae bacterium]